MTEQGRRIVIIEEAASLGYSDGMIIVFKEFENKNIPITQVSIIIINSLRVSISAWLISELAKNNVKLVFCNEKHNPCCELNTYGNNVFSSGRLAAQINWTDKEKAITWKKNGAANSYGGVLLADISC